MKKRVLIVDDIAFNLEFGEKVIKSLMDELNIDIEVHKAYTVEESFKKLDENAAYDAMVIDMQLSDGTGLEIAKYAKQKSLDTRMAALTIYPNKYDDQHDYFDLFLKKPISPIAYEQNLIRLLGL